MKANNYWRGSLQAAITSPTGSDDISRMLQTLCRQKHEFLAAGAPKANPHFQFIPTEQGNNLVVYTAKKTQKLWNGLRRRDDRIKELSGRAPSAGDGMNVLAERKRGAGGLFRQDE